MAEAAGEPAAPILFRAALLARNDQPDVAVDDVAGDPSASTRPSSIRTARCARRFTRPRSCDTKSTVTLRSFSSSNF